MTTPVEICNIASRMLGGGEISAIDPPDNTVQAALAAQLYPHVRQWVLRKHTWHSCKTRVILSPDAATPAFDYNYQFSLPANCLRIIQIGYKGDPIDYEIDSRKILCDETVLPIIYVMDNDNPSTYEPALVHTMIIAMKHAMSYPVTKSQSVTDSAMAELKAELQMARTIDGLDEPPVTFGDFPLLAAGFNQGL